MVNVVSHASRPKKQHLGRDAAKVKLQHDKQREAQTMLLNHIQSSFSIRRRPTPLVFILRFILVKAVHDKHRKEAKNFVVAVIMGLHDVK